MKKALIIINVSKEESMTLAQKIARYLEKKGIEHDFLSFDGFVDNTDFKGYDFVVSLGGDGTVLYAARNASKYGLPVFPVNLGEFGFIASVQPEEWEKELKSFLDGKSSFEKRTMLKVDVIRDGKKIYSSLSLNDAVISTQRGVSTVMLSVKRNNLPLCNLKADGLIIATPTGSTAYSTAAGGPIVSPDLEAFVLTPLNSFSLSSRPVVLSPDSKLEVTVEKSRAKDLYFTVDGQEPFQIKVGDIITVILNKKKAKLVACSTEKFYNALRSKLNWSGVPHA
ncbi:NAD+ kinase [Treponema bryantii]|uniref:NAD kinase n=1 Tax=Treponema bryantii TaxID=163 RepID=A0A1H9ACS0_9SPIR|nr:NAD(+)/NADH kinase [Treponema bryantii]SEP74474.1 NAD+ kinase [Treponema bryantii]